MMDGGATFDGARAQLGKGLGTELRHRLFQAIRDGMSLGNEGVVGTYCKEFSLCVASMMMLAERDLFSWQLMTQTRGNIDTSPPSQEDAGPSASSLVFYEGTLATLVTATTQIEKHAPFVKAIHELGIVDWCWSVAVRFECEDSTLGIDRLFASKSRCHRMGWIFRILGNVVACKERRVNDELLSCGAIDLAVQVMERASLCVRRRESGSVFFLSEEDHDDDIDENSSDGIQDRTAKREMLKQAARLIGNVCFGSTSGSSSSTNQQVVCGAQRCKSYLLERQTAASSTEGPIGSILHLAATMDAAGDRVMTRWLLHAVNEFVYGGAPSTRQKYVIEVLNGLNIVGGITRDALQRAIHDCGAEGSPQRAKASGAAVLHVSLSALNNVLFRVLPEEIKKDRDTCIVAEVAALLKHPMIEKHESRVVQRAVNILSTTLRPYQ